MHRQHSYYTYKIYCSIFSLHFVTIYELISKYFIIYLYYSRALRESRIQNTLGAFRVTAIRQSMCFSVCVIACNDNFHLSSLLDKHWLWFLLHAVILMAFYHLNCERMIVARFDVYFFSPFCSVVSSVVATIYCVVRAMCLHAKYGVGWLNCVAEHLLLQKKRLKLCQRDTGI